MKRLLLIAAVLTAFASPVLAQQGQPYRALGTEPFWSVTIGGGRMIFENMEGRQVSVATPRPVSTVDGRVYRSRQLVVRVSAGPCSDGMSDRRYADTVRVTVNGRELSGCGGATLPADRFDSSSWDIVRINGERVAGERFRMEFEAGRLSGVAGCNRFSGSYSQERGALQVGPLAMTRMGCPERAMARERTVADALRGRVSYVDRGRNALVLRGSNGTQIELRRRRP